MASKIPTVLTAKTPYEDMILYDNGRFANFTRQEYEGICQRFRKFDVDESNSIDLFELQLMMESIGETKTYAELKAMIAEVDKSKDGTYVDLPLLPLPWLEVCSPYSVALHMHCLRATASRLPSS